MHFPHGPLLKALQKEENMHFPHGPLRRERALPAWCTLRWLVRASAYYIERKRWKRRLWNMISFALLAVTLFRFLGKSIWSYCHLSLNVSRISKQLNQPPSLCSVCLMCMHASAVLIQYFKLTQAVRMDPYAKMEMLAWTFDIYIQYKHMTVNWKFFALRTHTHVSQHLTGQAFTFKAQNK